MDEGYFQYNNIYSISTSYQDLLEDMKEQKSMNLTEEDINSKIEHESIEEILEDRD